MKEKDAKIDELGLTIAKLERTVNKSPSSIDKDPLKTGDAEEDARRDKLKYSFTKIYSKDAKGQEFPVAWAMYFPNEDDTNKKWRVGTYPLEFHQTIVESENPDGTFNRAVEFHIENNKNKETKGIEFPVKLTDVKWEKMELKDKSISWWNPRLGLGAVSTNGLFGPKIDLSISSYGRTKVDMDWRFLTFGLGVYKDVDDVSKMFGTFEPFSWNLGKALPLIENVFIGPVITYDSEFDRNYGLSISVPF
jgi:hypothetical protein